MVRDKGNTKASVDAGELYMGDRREVEDVVDVSHLMRVAESGFWLREKNGNGALEKTGLASLLGFC